MNKILWFFLLPLFSLIPSEITNTTAQTLPFTQNWTNAALITSDNNWSLVPGIEGFTGNGLTFSTGSDPQTLVSPGFFPVTQVLANQSTPNTLTTGGVAEFDGIANPTIALQPEGASNANAPYIVISLNTTNQQNINVAYNLRDLDGSSDNAIQRVALQYRVGNSGNFTNIPAGYVADATTGPNLATLVTPVNAILPAAANNQTLVQVRIITADAVGIDEWVGIDDINITGNIINNSPVVTTTPGTTTYIYNTAVVVDGGITVTDADNFSLASAVVDLGVGFDVNDKLMFTPSAGTGAINGTFDVNTGRLSLSGPGTLSEWQVALRTVKFTCNNLPGNHTVSIKFFVYDGGMYSNIANKDLVVYPSPPPVVTTSAGNTNYVHSTPVVIDNLLTISDANNSTLASATLSFSSGFQQPSSDVLSFINNGTTMGNISGSYAALTGVLSLTSAGATATLAQWQSALRSVTFYISGSISLQNRVINFIANDGSNTSIAATKTIMVSPGLPPTVTSSAGNTTYIHSTPVIIDNGITVTDNDSPTLLSASITFSGSYEAGNDFLAFSNNGSTMGNISGSYSPATWILSLSSAGATATVAQWQAALRAVKYYNISNVPLIYDRIINFTINDGIANSNPTSKAISYMPVGYITQSWSPGNQVVEPNTGTGGNIGWYTQMLIANGNPAIIYYDNTRTNLVFKRATDVLGSSFEAGVTIDSIGNVGRYLSVQIVNGNPAIAYYDTTNHSLKFIRALDPNGATWGTPQSVLVGINVRYISLQVVNGNPAMAYYDYSNGDLKFIRAGNNSGSTWGSPVMIDGVGDQGQYPSMKIVDGNPAISYYDATNQDLKYIRATDISGISWGSPLSIDVTGDVGAHTCLQVINGNPAVSYQDVTNGLKYITANDASGTTWGTGQVARQSYGISKFQYTSLQEVNGYAAVSYYDSTNQNLKFVRAANLSGTIWYAPVTIADSAGKFASMQMVNGYPAVSCQADIYPFHTNFTLKYIRATDVSGGAWGLPITITSWRDIGWQTSLQMVNGNPALAIYDTKGFVQYIRASNTAGTIWGFPITVDTAFNGSAISMQIINGNPAISYTGRTGQLKYVRATNALGTAWGTPVLLDPAVSYGFYPSLLTVNGNPAIAYYDGTNKDLKFIRAADATGTTWNPAINLDFTGDVGSFSFMRIVNGNPAIVYYDGTSTNLDLKYVRANDASGTSWSAGFTVDAGGDVGKYASLQIVNNNPAISYYDQTNGDLKYIRAADVLGTSWNSSLTVDATGTTGHYTSLQIINTMPAIAYYDSSGGNLKYISAINISGTSWGTPVLLDTLQNTGLYVSMINSGNTIGISYYNKDQKLPFYLPGLSGFNSLATNYFRSKQNGNWNDPATWESSPDNIHWGNATLTPDFNSSAINVRTTHTINVTANVIVDQLTIDPGSTIITNTGVVFTVK